MNTEILGNEDNNTENEQVETQGAEEETLDNLFKVLEFREQAIVEAQEARDETLHQIAEKIGKTFCFRGQYYQICKRRNKKTGEVVTFMKTLPGAPKTWLKGMPKGGWASMRNGKTLENESEHPPAQEETVQPEDQQDEGTSEPEVLG